MRETGVGGAGKVKGQGKEGRREDRRRMRRGEEVKLKREEGGDGEGINTLEGGGRRGGGENPAVLAHYE